MIDTDDGFLPLLTRRVQTDPAGLFARYEGAPLTFGELDRMASALAAWMRAIGLVPGDAVALMIRNSPLALALLFAIAKARAVWVPINVQSRGENLGYIFIEDDRHSSPARRTACLLPWRCAVAVRRPLRPSLSRTSTHLD